VPLKFWARANGKSPVAGCAGCGDNPEHLVKSDKSVRASDTLPLKLAPSGGTVAIFSPAK